MNEPVYHLKDVADYCGVTVDTVREWIDRGLRAFPLGHSTIYPPRDYLIREAWLLAFLDAQAVVQPKPKPAAQAGAEKPKRPAGRPRPSKRSAGNILGPCPV